jgi:hypothetical protein
MRLSPEACGTFAALKHCRRIKYFTPDCAEALVAAGLARLEQNNVLAITKKGATAAVYTEAAPSSGAGDSRA